MKTISFLAIGSSFLLAACGGGGSPPPPPPPPPPQPVQISMAPSAWFFQYSPTMPTNPSPHAEGWSFDFPLQNGVHYLTQTVAGHLGPQVSASFRLERNGGELFEVEPCGTNAPKVRLFFQRRGDNMSGQGQYEFYRWWSKATFDLNQDGPISLSETTDWTQWTSVFGKSGDQNPTAFAAALGDVQAIGLTFGGCFAGHGVFANGAVRFIVNGYTAN